MFLTGSYISYNEFLYDTYKEYTVSDYSTSYSRQLEYKLKQLPIFQKLNHPNNTHQWYKLSSWENLDRNVLDNVASIKDEDGYKEPTLTNQTLRKPGGIFIKPVIFHNIETDEGVTILHVGYRLCGYPFIVHGGIIATLLNETFKRNASLSKFTSSNLKDDFRVENLTINYKFPTFANQFLIVKTRLKEDSKDKKTILLESCIENAKGKLLVKSTALLHDTGRATNRINAEEQKKKQSWW
ncbi:unnamed protein product [Candida verbasci]|uniref:Thioesterase domain-containing protein n=1 Tax=Candida verbasci TaxID=1227364 RepID=A0A9W4U0I7_9ASCO|nr:unnamed protein product [Candida verbasci]